MQLKASMKASEWILSKVCFFLNFNIMKLRDVKKYYIRNHCSNRNMINTNKLRKGTIKSINYIVIFVRI